ncbi:helix-turn-helix domain-containing protein [Kribbella jiaozuonensis]|uniref:Helix-turn-helix domain-containing protein n=1 Tax=Kribbella jiaozuonensis TaxID=2575441 RepID=A0A4U3LWK5_9ACTN|nr:helix-turn-helix transcriptional regulator [Kribbella jiaozuonensis]TKK80575.1 helix-turn-helix domain-containing protein [Kribbella jiaozuonensis]
MLGGQLRRMREAAGISRADAGWQIRASESKVSRMELGRVGFKERDVSDLLELYGMADTDERFRLMELARAANNPGWWSRYGDVMPSWFTNYVGLEVAAALIRTYEVMFVPGLLQTEEYARAMVQLGKSSFLPHQEVDQRVELRVTRQQILTRANPARLWVVIDESVLHRPVGGEKVLRAQIEHLIMWSQQPNITLQVMPFSSVGYAGAGGAFSLLRFPEGDLPDIVYIEHAASALYLDKLDEVDEVDEYVAIMEGLTISAAPVSATEGLLKEALARI